MHNSQVIRIVFLALILLTVMAIVSGCSGNIGAAPTPQFQAGTYTNPGSRYGEELKLFENGTYATTAPGTLIPFEGTYVVMEDEVVFTETAAGHCIGVPGKYKWAFDGEALTFVVVEDQCSLRRIAWASGPWTKQP